MRLKSMYLLCKDYTERIPELAINKLFERGTSETYYSLNIQSSIWKDIIEELNNLEQIEVLHPIVKEIKDIIIKDGKTCDHYVETVKDSLVKKFSSLYLQMRTIRDLCESLGYSKDEYIGFDFKIPIREDFATMAKVLNDFNKIVSQAPFLDINDARIQYKKVDLGSTWIEFIIVGSAAGTLLNIFASFIDNCIEILSHKRSCKQQEEEYRRMKISNDLVEGMCKAHQEMTKALTDKFINELSEDIEPEGQARAKLCYDMMVDLLDEGVEIYQVATKNECDKLLFPTSERWKEINCNLLNHEGIEEKQED